MKATIRPALCARPATSRTRWLPTRALYATTLALTGLFTQAAALAQSGGSTPAPGTVKTATGQAWVVVDGRPVVAHPGTPVPLRSRLITGAYSAMGVTFRDETVMSIGPDSQLTVDQYLFSPANGQASLAMSLARGTLNYVSGWIAKLRPDGVSVQTPSAVIGVRGTQFVVRVDAP